MANLMIRLRSAVSSLGNDGALANVVSELARAAADRRAVEALEARMASRIGAGRSPLAA
jgi:hypothetical protein